MSVKIRVSYENDAEFEQIQNLLSPLGLRVNMPSLKKGKQFLRAYLYDRHSAPYYGEREEIVTGSENNYYGI